MIAWSCSNSIDGASIKEGNPRRSGRPAFRLFGTLGTTGDDRQSHTLLPCAPHRSS
jgi:hypothetical protein